MTAPSERELDRAFVRLASGDRSVLTQVFHGLWPTVHQFCRRYLGNDADADDAAQRALEKLFAQASNFDASRPVMAWAVALAHFECRTLRRRATRNRTVELDVEPEHPDGSPELALELAQLNAALDAAMLQLSEQDRETLVSVLASGGSEGVVQDDRFRKRKQRAVARLKQVWRRLHDT